MNPTNGYKLDELAREAGVSARTVRYYVQRGLLAPPVFRGKDTVYTGEHLARLRAIRELQGKFLPLDAIQAEFSGRPEDKRGSAPASPPVPAPAAGGRWERWIVAPGLEIHLSEDADVATRALARELRDTSRRRNV